MQKNNESKAAFSILYYIILQFTILYYNPFILEIVQKNKESKVLFRFLSYYIAIYYTIFYSFHH
jgi:hypothetical protein